MEHTKGPWKWMGSGTLWALLGDHGSRPVVLSGSDMRQRDERGLLVDFDPDSPDGVLLAGAATLLAVCCKFRRADLPEREQPLWDELQMAICNAKGEHK